MAWVVIFSRSADKQFAKLDRQIQQQILTYVAKLESAEDPLAFAKPLTSGLVGLWRYRVGKYRLICEMHKKILTIEVISIGKRDKIYH